MKYALLLIMNLKNEILLLQRNNSVAFGAGYYSLPGGKLEKNETPRNAAIREALEELGIYIKPENLEFVHLLFRNGAETVFDASCFKVKEFTGNPTIMEPELFDDLKFFNINELPENILPAHKQIIESIQNKIYYSEHGF